MPGQSTATPTLQALVIGEALIDAVVSPDGSREEIPGGSPMNVAIGLARLGQDAELATWLGGDERGNRIREHLAADGVALMPGSSDAASTAVAEATLAADGSATYVFDLEWAPRTVAPTRSPQVVHTGSIGAVLDPGMGAVVTALEGFARSRTPICYDPNARPSLMGEAADARKRVERIVALADVVKTSDEDIAWLIGDDSEEALQATVQEWLASGPRLVVVTRGGEGATAWTRGAADTAASAAEGATGAAEGATGVTGARVDVKSESVAVADTVGAGDSFTAGLIDGLWRAGFLSTRDGERAADLLATIPAETLELVLRRCARIAGITVSRAGANPPRLAELGDLAEVPNK